MKQALLFTSHIEQAACLPKALPPADVICADGGYLRAKEAGFHPDFLIGDFDSAPRPARADLLLPREKDASDTEIALAFALQRNYEAVYLIGGLGGRFDHTLANLSVMARYAEAFHVLGLIDGENHIEIKTPGTYRIDKNIFGKSYDYLGLAAFPYPVEGLTIRKCKYELTDALLSPLSSLGISNEITGSYANISFQKGLLVVTRTSDPWKMPD